MRVITATRIADGLLAEGSSDTGHAFPLFFISARCGTSTTVMWKLIAVSTGESELIERESNLFCEESPYISISPWTVQGTKSHLLSFLCIWIIIYRLSLRFCLARESSYFSFLFFSTFIPHESIGYGRRKKNKPLLSCGSIWCRSRKRK